MGDEEIRREWFEKDYYAVLGVPKNADAGAIKKAYRKLAQAHHPDANAGNAAAEERFKEISAAYDVLGDPDKRQAYDRVRDMAASGFRGGGFPGAGAGGGGGFGGFGGQTVDLDDLLGGMFGGRGRGGRGGGSGAQRGADLETLVKLSFDDAMAGATVPVTLTGPATCTACRGSGAAPGTTAVTCPDCGGVGVRAVNQGFFQLNQTCPHCGGSGRIVETPCPTCRGTGSERRTRTIQVKIPTGVKDGARIKLAGKGESGGAGGQPGDLYVKVQVAKHPVFGRKGNDLLLTLPITYPEAALGGQIQVPTLDGPVTLKIPAGTPGGKTFRIKGRGAPRKGGHGDLLATVQVDVPKPSREQKKLLEQYQDTLKDSPRRSLGVT
jgi:molecular chaperone DnaJ